MGSSASGGNTAAWGAASSSSSGMMTTGAQTIGGAKTFQDGMFGPGSVPLGCMIVAMPNIDAVNSWQPPLSGAIKDGFMRADGTIINAGHISQGCLLAAGTVLPNMIQKYPRGNTTSGTTGGSNTFTPAGTNATSNVPATGLSFSGSSTSYSVSVPAHYHGIGTGAGLSAAGQTLGTSNVSLASGACSIAASTYSTGNDSPDHSHGIDQFGNGNSGHLTAVQQNGFSTADAGNGIHNTYNSGGASARHTHSIPAMSGSASGTTNIGHTHAASTVTGTIGLVTGGVDGNAAHTASGNNTPSGSITGTATAAAQAFTGTSAPSEPAYVEVVWVIRVK